VALHLWPPSLADALRDGTLRDRDKLVYVAAGSVFATGLNRLRASAWTAEVLVFDLACLAIVLGGVFWSHSMNKRGDGRHFVERFYLLAVPVSLATYILFFGLYYGLGLLAAAAGLLEQWPRTAATVVSALLALVITYWWLGKLMLRASLARTA
jgi:hypothetical protein